MGVLVMSPRRFGLFIVCLLLGWMPAAAVAQPISSRLYDSLRWRMIGPFRGGRTVGATGVPGKPNVLYVGVNNGGGWKTTGPGRTWKPFLDDQPTGSKRSLAAAPSNAHVLSVCSGATLQLAAPSTRDA